MPLSPAQEERLAILKEEIDFIHTANYRYWMSPGGEHSREARAEYVRRRIRLNKIRDELNKMTCGSIGKSIAMPLTTRRKPPRGARLFLSEE
jgi:hypothetical protein